MTRYPNKEMSGSVDQWCQTEFSLSPRLPQLWRQRFYCCQFCQKWEICSLFIIRNAFMSNCLSPHLILLSPHVANGDKVGQHCGWQCVPVIMWVPYPPFKSKCAYFNMFNIWLVDLSICWVFCKVSALLGSILHFVIFSFS